MQTPSAPRAPPSPPPTKTAASSPSSASSHVAFSRARRAAFVSPSKTKWSWLHATTCSCAVVAAGAYMHAAFQSYVDQWFASLLETRLILPWRSLLVVTLLLAWAVSMAVLRTLGVHAPVHSLLRLTATRVVALRASLAARHKTMALPAVPRLRLHGRAPSVDLTEIDTDDMLVVTALSAEPRRPTRRGSQLHESSPVPSTVSSTSSRESTETVDADDEVDAQILLHPQDGAKGGRHASNHIIVDDPYVSRFHFEIGYDPLEKEYFLRDLGSTTGTFVFLKPDTPKRLSVDDRVRLGDTELQIVAIDVNATTGTPFLRLVFTEGPLRGVAQTLGRTPVTLGRRSTNALCITDDASISGRHCSIAYLGDGFYVTDLQSTNGTALRLSASGVASAKRFLLHGDVFGVGANRFLVEYAQELQLQEKHRTLHVHGGAAAHS
jgi:pSer/pThr/pTyr-binding forkhead associated (FHA) protein